jgi:hypothetical protein
VVGGAEFDLPFEPTESNLCPVLVMAAPGLPGCRCSSNVAPGIALFVGSRDGCRSGVVALGKLPSVEWEPSCRSGGFADSTASKNKLCRVEEVVVDDGLSECNVPVEGEEQQGDMVCVDLS